MSIVGTHIPIIRIYIKIFKTIFGTINLFINLKAVCGYKRMLFEVKRR